MALYPSRESGWYVVEEWSPYPDTLKWFSVFSLLREIAAATIFSRRDLRPLSSIGSLDEAVQAHTDYNSSPHTSPDGVFFANIKHV